MEQATIIKIFLASPSDVKAEREVIFALKDDLDHLIGKPNRLRFEFVNWERTAYPGIGEDAQDVINKNIKDDYNIFIGIFWKRFGTPTNRAESGTKEEYDRAYRKFTSDPNSCHIMLYFKTASPENIYDFDFEQFKKVKEFKNYVQTQGVLYWEFNKTEELKNLLLLHLSSLVKDKFVLSNSNLNTTLKKEKEKLDKYELLAQEIDDQSRLSNIEGMIDLIDKTNYSMNQLSNISKNITSVVEFIAGKFTDKTKQVKALSYIKDDRLRFKKSTQVINSLAVDLDMYSDQLNELLPDFRSNLNTAIESYTKLLFSAFESSIFVDEVELLMKTLVPKLYNLIDRILTSIGDFLMVLRDLPTLTSKFANSKRKSEITTNELLKEFISARKIVEQLMNKNLG